MHRTPALRASSEAALRQELEWASHLSLQACILRLPASHAHANLARIVNQVRNPLDCAPSMLMHVLLTLH